jgi:hypothetical protein
LVAMLAFATEPPPEVVWYCTTSSNPANNTMHCQALESGHGDACRTEGTGPGCNGSGAMIVS